MRYFNFWLSSPEKLKEISTPLAIACGGNRCAANSIPVYRCNAIWDTGATSSMIAQHIAEELKLESTGKVQIAGVHGVTAAKTYIVSLLFGNGFAITDLPVSEADNGGGFDVLIGMDVISKGKLLVDGLRDGCQIVFEFPETS
jgi:hypothetical protein